MLTDGKGPNEAVDVWLGLGHFIPGHLCSFCAFGLLASRRLQLQIQGRLLGRTARGPVGVPAALLQAIE